MWPIYSSDVCFFVVPVKLFAQILFERGSDLKTFCSKEEPPAPFPWQATACVSLKGLHGGVQ